MKAWHWAAGAVLLCVMAGAFASRSESTAPTSAPERRPAPATPAERASTESQAKQPDLPPLEELVIQAKEKKLPEPPPLATATEAQVKAFSEQLRSSMMGRDPETLKIARNLELKFRSELRKQRNAERQGVDASRRAAGARDRERMEAIHRAQHPQLKPPGPPTGPPPPNPLQGPPAEGIEAPEKSK